MTPKPPPVPPGARAGVCRGCGAPIWWVRTCQGKNVPLDQRLVVMLPSDEGWDTSRKLGRSAFAMHHAVCPDRAQFRKEPPSKAAVRP